MKQYSVKGMSCAACSARVENAVKKVDGVTFCTVNLLTNSMNVDGTASDNAVMSAVRASGYDACVVNDKSKSTNGAFVMSEHTENISSLKKRLFSSAIFLIILMYVSMGHTMFGFWLPQFFSHNYIALGLIQLILTGIIMVINKNFFVSGFKGLIHRSPNMDTLVSLGSLASFGYSLYALFMLTDANVLNDEALSHTYFHEFYFESAAMILTLITFGKLLEAISKGKTTNALKDLYELSPKTAIVIKDSKQITVDINDVNVGDVFVVKPGMSVPVDGVIISGDGVIDESALTGESVPVEKTVGQKVSAATVNLSGYFEGRAEHIGEDTALSKIIKMVSDAAAGKAPIAKVADKVSGFFVPTVILIALLTTVIWLLIGNGVGFAIARGVSVLVISCPCALGLATPVAVMVGNGVGARHGILFKTAESLEQTGKVDTVVLDKTGTITLGEPAVVDIIPFNIGVDELLQLAYSLEIKSEHPLAKAIVRRAEADCVKALEVNDFESFSGKGLKAQIQGCSIVGGNFKYISQNVNINDNAKLTIENISKNGQTPILFAKDRELIGIIAISDQIKSDALVAIDELKHMGIDTVMLTGDNSITANAIAKEVGINRVISGVMPDGKKSVIDELKINSKVVMVGDGINDAPALTSADTGIAIGTGTDIAIDSADVVVMNKTLRSVPTAIALSRATLRTIHQNLFWAFVYNIVGIPLAAGAFIELFGWQLNPMFAAAAMSLSSFCVVTNALRLNFFNDKKIKKYKYTPKQKRRDNAMEITLKISGMMCEHCEKRVKDTIIANASVLSAEVSHKTGTAVIKAKDDVDVNAIKQAIVSQGYNVE